VRLQIAIPHILVGRNVYIFSNIFPSRTLIFTSIEAPKTEKQEKSNLIRAN